MKQFFTLFVCLLLFTSFTHAQLPGRQANFGVDGDVESDYHTKQRNGCTATASVNVIHTYGVLPVMLLNFSGEVSGEKVQLAWTVARMKPEIILSYKAVRTAKTFRHYLFYFQPINRVQKHMLIPTQLRPKQTIIA